MAVTAALVYYSPNHLRYLLTQDGAAGTTLSITTTGAATPDLRTDSVAGPIKNLALAATNGFAAFAAGALTQAQARALWLSDWSTDPGNELNVTAKCVITPRSGTVLPGWKADANVSSGNPIISIVAQATAGTCYLDVEVEGGAIGA